ncbi:MAG: bifunctional UDP-N-acetylglucosamine diphosphorylase/glucosamine-1-phosphate N-acetyltransferase GlmU [Sandaracinaceae bacterium]
MPDAPFATLVLAAGKGTRMKSDLPKVLHDIAGRPMIAWAVGAALEAGSAKVVAILGHGREEVEAALADRFDARVTSALQAEQRGTGHAARSGLPALDGFDGDVLITCGDVPLLEPEALGDLAALRRASGAPLAVLTCRAPDPTGYGRILRNADGRVVGIREHKDASPEERRIDEINSGVYAADAAFLREALEHLSDDNAQGELYLTDIVARAAERGGAAALDWPFTSILGVNDRAQLAEATARMRRRIAIGHARNGVTFADLDRASIDAEVRIARDARLEVGVVLRGRTVVGEGAFIDVGCVLENVEVAAGAHLRPYSVALESRVGPGAKVGPFSHLRPGSDLGPSVHVGNFVETKKTRMAEGAKANHLAYLGDGVIHEGVNVGAGTIFCNYDGFQKHVTTLEKGAFIGSDSQLVAPITVGENAYVATGTTVTKDVPKDALAVGRVRQSNKEGYAARLRVKLKAAADEAKAAKAAKASKTE